MKYGVFIQTNHKQYIGALVAQHAIRRYSKHNDQFDVHIMHIKDWPMFRERDGQMYLRDGVQRVWSYDDLQSFTLTRFMPPELMDYQGRSVVIDPDVFAHADVWDLFSRDMQDKAIMVRPRTGAKGRIARCLATSVMLLDNSKLHHWNVARQFNEMFTGELDYADWICLKNEDRSTIGLFENEWNDFDRLTPATRMLHTTKRRTQPWKTGLPVDFRPAEVSQLFPPLTWARRARRKLFGEYGLLGHYQQHPDPKQEQFFFGLLKECLDNGTVTEAMVREQMQHNHVRHDALKVLDRTPDLPAAK